MNRQTFIRSLAAVAALQAIPASVFPVDINHVQAQRLPAIKLHDVLISPEGEAFNVIGVMFGQVMARVIDGDQCILITEEQAQAMCCHDWDDLDQ